MIYRILGIILPVFAVVIAGYVYARIARPSMGGANKANMDKNGGPPFPVIHPKDRQ